MRLLIAEHSALFAHVLAQRLEEDIQVRICYDGVEALELLQSFRPDTLVLNLQLPMKDGLTVLRQSAYIPPTVLATASYVSDHIQRTAYALGVTQVVLMPTVHTLAVTLTSLLRSAGEKARRPDLRAQARMHLQSLNFQMHRAGSKQLAVALPLFALDPEQKLSIQLYPAVAEALDIPDWRAVERAMRTAIQNAWDHRDPQVWEKYFPGEQECPNNKRFLARMVTMMEK